MRRNDRQRRHESRRRPAPPGGKHGVSVLRWLIAAALAGSFGGLALSFKDGAEDPASLAKGELSSAPAQEAFSCTRIHVVDGDTLRCDGRRVRLEGIDAPEMDGRCRQGRQCTAGDPDASKANLERLAVGGNLRCIRSDVDHYGRIVARCRVGGRDLSCAQVKDGHAVLRYAPIRC